jgi:hypothetical protein
MNSRTTKLVEIITGRRDPAAAASRAVLGVLVPLVVITYALSCIVMREATIIGKGALETVIGLPAVAVGVAYATAGVILYVYVCWDDHPQFAGIRDAVLQLLLIVVALAMAVTFALALI